MAALLSGAPSTLWAVVRGEDPLAATRAAGGLLLPRRGAGVLPAAIGAHAALSIGWAGVLAATMPRRLSTSRALAFGGAAGALIGAVDLGAAHGLAHPRFAAIRALPLGPQVADHIAFGACVALVLARAESQSTCVSCGSAAPHLEQDDRSAADG